MINLARQAFRVPHQEGSFRLWIAGQRFTSKECFFTGTGMQSYRRKPEQTNIQMTTNHNKHSPLLLLLLLLIVIIITIKFIVIVMITLIILMMIIIIVIITVVVKSASREVEAVQSHVWRQGLVWARGHSDSLPATPNM